MQSSYIQQADVLSNPALDDHGMLHWSQQQQFKMELASISKDSGTSNNRSHASQTNLLKAAEHKFMVAEPVSKSQAR